MQDLAAWLRKQIAMDEATARAMTHAIENLQSRWSPARLLADCEAKRRILDAAAAYSPELEHGDNGEWALDMALRALALPYAHLAGYREEWKP